MTDIASAIKMEEEALQRMKKQSLQKSVPTTHSSSMIKNLMINLKEL